MLGTQYYLIFAVDKNGVPIQAELISSRSRDEIRINVDHAITQLRGIDIIVSDGSTTILSAVSGMYKSLLLVQQIRNNEGKRAIII